MLTFRDVLQNYVKNLKLKKNSHLGGNIATVSIYYTNVT